MYNCNLKIYLAGSKCRFFTELKKIPPLNNFTHHFFESELYNEDFAKNCDVIFLNFVNEADKSVLKSVTEAKKKRTQLIVIAGCKHISLFTGFLPEISDVWQSADNEAEIKFRITKWQDTLKTKTDLWETNQYLNNAINMSPNLVWYKDINGIHIKVNDSFCKTVKKTKRQVEGRDHYYIWDIDPHNKENIVYDCSDSDMEVINSKKTCTFEETITTGSGMRFLSTYKTPLFDLDGSVMGTVGIAVDKTREKTYKEEIEKKNIALESIFSSIDCGILCHSVEGNHILSVNKTALNILGYSSVESLAADFDMVAGSVLDEDKIILRKAFKTLQNVGDSVSTEYSVIHSDGKIIHVTGNAKLMEENGELYYQRFLLDSTEQKQQEETNERLQKELVQALSSGYSFACFYNADTDDGFPLAIDAAYNNNFSYDKNLSFRQNINNYINTFVYEADRDLIHNAFKAENLDKEFADKNQFYLNYRTDYNNKILNYEMKVVRTGDKPNSHSLVLGFRNVDTEKRKNEDRKILLETALAQAKSANRAKSVFLSNMSHDIRTPMNAIIGFTDLALDKTDQPEKMKEYLNKIKISGNHLLELINNVLDMSRIESGRVFLEESPCSLTDVLAELKNMFQNDADSKNLKLCFETHNLKNTNVYCDKTNLIRVLVNVINNSVKYTNNGGSIWVTLEEKPCRSPNRSNYKFVVKDTGIGMSEEFISHIFELFERERNTTDSGIQGTGLGMAIIKNIVDLMHGSVDVKSKKGEGTTVTIRLSLLINDLISANNALSKNEADTAPRTHKGNKGKRILLAEDNEINREIAVEIIKKFGYEIECAENGKTAVNMLLSSQPGYYSAILMDVQMPVLNGYEATKIIRALKNKSFASIPILAMTANAFEEDKQEALKCGMNGHIAKPINVNQLILELNKYI